MENIYKKNKYLIVVNKERKIKCDYVPKELVNTYVTKDREDEKKFMDRRAAKALKKLFFAALCDKIELVAVSGYRSYYRQKEIYENAVNKRGEMYAQKYIAKPGESEHQTGLAMDVSSKKMNYMLEEEFAETKEGMWIANNSSLYGFIIRYPKNKEDITGYNYEPWHIRYVGRKNAIFIYKNNIVLEEFVNLR